MYFDDLKLGMTVETAPAVIEKEKMLAFACEYDNIPLHTDEEYAREVEEKMKETEKGDFLSMCLSAFLVIWLPCVIALVAIVGLAYLLLGLPFAG